MSTIVIVDEAGNISEVAVDYVTEDHVDLDHSTNYNTERNVIEHIASAK